MTPTPTKPKKGTASAWVIPTTIGGKLRKTDDAELQPSGGALTLSRLMDLGGFEVDTALLEKHGFTLDDFIQAFGNCTLDDYNSLKVAHSMSTEYDKVITNPNLVQGAETTNNGLDVSAEDMERVLAAEESTARSRRILDALNDVGHKPVITPEPAPVVRPLEPASAPSVAASAPAPAPAAEPAQDNTVAEPRLDALARWATENELPSRARKTGRSLMLEPELLEFVSAVSDARSRQLGVALPQSMLLRSIIRTGLLAEYKKLKDEQK